MPITAFEVGWLGKIENTYGTAATLSTTTDGLMPYIPDDGPEAPTPVNYVFDGNIGRRPGSGPAPAQRMPPAGRFAEFPFPCLFRGNGDEYTALKLPPTEVDVMLQAAGFTRALNTDEWRYTLTPLGNTFKGATIRRYAHGRTWETSGTLFDWTYEASGLGAPIHTFNGRGKMANVPVDGALPSITLPTETVFPALAQAVVANLGDFAFGGTSDAALRSTSFALNRSVDNPRLDQTLEGGHAGFMAGYCTPTWTVVMERTAQVLTPFHTANGIDAEALREAATTVPLAFRYGTTAAERWTIGAESAQLANVTPSSENGIALVTLEFVGLDCYVLFD